MTTKKSVARFLLSMIIALSMVGCEGEQLIEPTHSQDLLVAKMARDIQEVDANEDDILLIGNGGPSVNLGEIGDMYLDKVGGLLYGPKTSKGWDIVHDLKIVMGIIATVSQTESQNAVLVGSPEIKVWSGKSIPSLTMGSIGDYYLNTNTRVLYGPKTSKGWGKGIRLMKPTLSSDNVSY